MSVQDYIPPGTEENDSDEYLLPSLDVMLEDLRRCGGDLSLFLIRFIELREERYSVRLKFAELLEQDETARAKYLKLIDLALWGMEPELYEARLRAEIGGSWYRKRLKELLEEYASIKFQLPIVRSLLV